MKSMLLLVVFFGSTLAQLFHHVNLMPTDVEFHNVNGKNFSSLAKAKRDAELFVEDVMEKQGIPSLVYGLSFGKQSWSMEESLGYIDLENQVPASLRSKYRLASITKTFTSALIGRLV